jgi:protease IV
MSVTETTPAVETTRLKKRLGRWRIAAIVAGLIALAALFWPASEGKPRQPHIARITISGMITDDRRQLDLLQDVLAADSVKAVMLAINSPGGTTAGGEALFEAITNLAKKKPVVAVQGTIATSAAYMISLPTDRIFARSSTITGSVGVIVQFPEVSEALGKLGIKMHEIKSGALKASPSTFQPLDEGGRQLLDQMVKEGQVWFLGMVKDRRKIDTTQVPGLEAGAVFSGRRALEYKMIDEIGGEHQAVAWLEASKGVAPKLEIIDWKPKRETRWDGGWLGSSDSGWARVLGVAFGQGLAESMVGSGPIESLQLDGLLSIWQAG